MQRSAMQWHTVSLTVILSGVLLSQTEGHGYMKSPPGRTYAWEYYKAPDYFPVNYNYNQNFCGGLGTQYNSINKGACGVCGDEYRLQRPRPNERGGKYTTGNIVAQYASGDVINVDVVLTANHKGKFYFDICPTESPKAWENEWCFQPLQVVNSRSGNFESSYEVSPNQRGTFKVQLYIPNWMSCTYCVLRWRYKTGNNWGCADDNPSKCCTGCGSKQEHFYSCADIMITSSGNEPVPDWVKVDKSGTLRPQLTTTWRPAATTTTRSTTSTTTTTTAPGNAEPRVCSRFCAGVCKPLFHFNIMCIPRLCGKCRVYQQFVFYEKLSG